MYRGGALLCGILSVRAFTRVGVAAVVAAMTMKKLKWAGVTQWWRVPRHLTDKTTLKMPRTRDTAGAQEAVDIAEIVEGIRTRTGCGPKIMAAFSEQFGVEILDARPRQRGNRGTHYDFEVLVGPAPGVWRRVEHKGSAACVPVSPTDTPWAAGVQFYNGGCEKYTIALKFARAWYDVHVGSGSLKAAWGITAEIPPFEKWYTEDAKRQGDPRTAFGRELKACVRAARGVKGSLRDERAPVVAAFEITEEDLRVLGEEAIPILNEALDQKDYWLTIHGDPTGEFHCRWWPPFRLVTPTSITVRKELDIWFDFVCEGGISVSLLLRWGKGAGFSNLRIDAR
jgi:hypothetical protein